MDAVTITRIQYSTADVPGHDHGRHQHNSHPNQSGVGTNPEMWLDMQAKAEKTVQAKVGVVEATKPCLLSGRGTHNQLR